MQIELPTTKDRTSKDLHKKVLQLDLAKFDIKEEKTLSGLIRERQLQQLCQPQRQNLAHCADIEL